MQNLNRTEAQLRKALTRLRGEAAQQATTRCTEWLAASRAKGWACVHKWAKAEGKPPPINLFVLEGQVIPGPLVRAVDKCAGTWASKWAASSEAAREEAGAQRLLEREIEVAGRPPRITAAQL